MMLDAHRFKQKKTKDEVAIGDAVVQAQGVKLGLTKDMRGDLEPTGYTNGLYPPPPKPTLLLPPQKKQP